MKGSIRARTKGTWEITVDIGRDATAGKRLRHFETVSGGKREAEKRLAEVVASFEKGVYVKPNKLTLGEYLHQWLQGYVKTSCSIRTLDSYGCIVGNHLAPGLGNIFLPQLQPQHIQKFYGCLMTEGSPNGHVLGSRTVEHIHRVLSEALNHAVRQGLLSRNACDFVDLPKVRKAEMKTLTPHEVAILLAEAQKTIYHPIIFTAVNTGLRQGELLGLRWKDLDLDLCSLSVTQALYKRRGVCIFQQPKSDHSRRRVELSPALSLFLRKYRATREAERRLLGKQTTGDDLVFSDITGKPLDPGTLTKHFARIAQRAGLQGTRFHDLRHTFASLMLFGGVNPKIISEALGHASVAFTLDVYSHCLPTMQKAAMQRLDEILQPELEGNVGKMSAKSEGLDIASGRN